MHIYAFGSVSRGDVTFESDIDLLAAVDNFDNRFDPEKYSIYSYDRLEELWGEGNPFAWHLALESKIVFALDGSDFIEEMGPPSRYNNCRRDCERFRDLFDEAFSSIQQGTSSLVFELSTIFLAIRNLATCYSLGYLKMPTFGRDSARRLGNQSVPLSDSVYNLLMRARILSTRGYGDDINRLDIGMIVDELETCRRWMNQLCFEASKNG